MPPTTKQTTLSSVEIIKQYPGPEQVELKVINEIPGAWFGGTSTGALNPSERREHYEAQAVEYAAVHEFKPPGGRGRVIRMRRSGSSAFPTRWTRPATAASGCSSVHGTATVITHTKIDAMTSFLSSKAGSMTSRSRPLLRPRKQSRAIRAHFDVVETGTHEQKDGEILPCTWYKCTRPQCKLKTTIKEVRKNTGLLYRHMSKCDPSLWRELRLGSKHSKYKQGEDGEEVEVRRPAAVLRHPYTFAE